jgi:hypothetical protein
LRISLKNCGLIPAAEAKAAALPASDTAFERASMFVLMGALSCNAVHMSSIAGDLIRAQQIAFSY